MKRRFRFAALAAASVLLVGAAGYTLIVIGIVRLTSPPSFTEQACSLPRAWLDRTQRGYFAPRSGQISLLPATPAYMATGAGGWSHSGPWEYLQHVPLLFYGPGIVPETGAVDRPATLADAALTVEGLLKGSFRADGAALEEVAGFGSPSLLKPRPKLILTVVWDGGGINTLERWPDSWPNLKRLIDRGVYYSNATVGSSPSVTPSVHTTLGTGFYPSTSGITGVPVRDESGEVVDSFLSGESSRFVEVPTVAERWDQRNDNEPLIGMIGYEPWHLGMIGRGAEVAGGDRDHAAWLNVETNEWITNDDHYSLPPSLPATGGLEEDITALDARDGRADGAWGSHEILDEPSRIEETPAFIAYHARALVNVIEEEGYGADEVTDLMFTNFKQIDRVGHYFNMASDEVRQSLEESDERLGEIVAALDRAVGRGEWVLIVTADHGQQPDQDDIDGYGIDPKEVRRDINARFGDVAIVVWPTEVFLDEAALRREEVSVEDVARFLSDYRLSDNVAGFTRRLLGAGDFRPYDRLFDMAIPSEMLPSISCG